MSSYQGKKVKNKNIQIPRTNISQILAMKRRANLELNIRITKDGDLFGH